MDKESPAIVASMSAQMQYSQVRAATNGDRIWKMGWEIDALDTSKATALIGEMAFGLNFNGVFLGEGVTVSTSGARRDAENNARAKVEVVVPEIGSKGNQIDLFAGKAASMVAEAGSLEFIEEQMSFDLTKRA